jgi:hypothetical protein
MTVPIALALARSGIRNMTIAPGNFSRLMLLTRPQAVRAAPAA